jgi:hypothetical protein
LAIGLSFDRFMKAAFDEGKPFSGKTTGNVPDIRRLQAGMDSPAGKVAASQSVPPNRRKCTEVA